MNLTGSARAGAAVKRRTTRVAGSTRLVGPRFGSVLREYRAEVEFILFRAIYADRLDLIEMSLSNTGTVLITKKLQPHLKLSLLPAVCWVRERPGTIVSQTRRGGKLRAIRGPREILEKTERFDDHTLISSETWTCCLEIGPRTEPSAVAPGQIP